MRQSVICVIFSAALLLHSSCASPMGLAEESSLEQDTLASLLSEEVTDNIRGEADLFTDGKSRGQRVIVVADPSLWRDLRALHNGMPLYKRRADDNSQVVEHRNSGQELSIPILRRDTMRCMVGRVYRPCWEV
ncbi:pro-melanin-concentrating hormone, like [Corythoichthys intestinalis]|uniref:pro-melanin-concentrating hormone, like n=1 Tax=Corythoichthys intestinalis TaxID=161448 RepID=UPI0025A4EEC2|nr:pro-melanin-concentrating hormone, like [Corythoichthys intestinalis]XP_061800687.1 pro-MCH-like [Nerophis lumbriciformis]